VRATKCKWIEDNKVSKILISANSGWNIVNFRAALIADLLSCGYEVEVLVPADSYAPEIRELGVSLHFMRMTATGMRPWRELLAIYDISRTVLAVRPDLLLNFTVKPNLYSSLVAALLRIPSIATITGIGRAIMGGAMSRRLILLLYRIAGMSRFSHFVFQNDVDRALFVDRKIVKTHATTLIRGSGVDVDKFRPRADRPNTTAVTFVFVGRIMREKGIREFVSAAQAVYASEPAVSFAAIGSFESPSEGPHQLPGWLGSGIDGAVRFHGHVTDVHHFMSNADCVVLPSYREGLSRSLLEAAAMAKPIITTNVPGCRDIVSDGINGFLCAPQSAASLEHAIRRFLRLSSEERAAMGMEGRRLVEKYFSNEIITREYVELVKTQLSRRAVRP